MLDYLASLKGSGVTSLLEHGREVLAFVRGGGLIPLSMTMGRTQARGPNFFAVFGDLSQTKKNEDELRQAFEPYGQVDRVSILTDRDTGRSRGFAFVEMANAEEGEKAIAGLNGTQLGGRTINVNEARPKAERAGGGGGRDRDRGRGRH